MLSIATFCYAVNIILTEQYADLSFVTKVAQLLSIKYYNWKAETIKAIFQFSPALSLPFQWHVKNYDWFNAYLVKVIYNNWVTTHVREANRICQSQPHFWWNTTEHFSFNLDSAIQKMHSTWTLADCKLLSFKKPLYHDPLGYQSLLLHIPLPLSNQPQH